MDEIGKYIHEALDRLNRQRTTAAYYNVPPEMVRAGVSPFLVAQALQETDVFIERMKNEILKPVVFIQFQESTDNGLVGIFKADRLS